MLARRTPATIRATARRLVLAALVAGCAGTLASDPPASSPIPPTPPATATPAPATPTSPIAPGSGSAEPVPGRPPAAAITVEGGAVAGDLGTFTWGDLTSDAPWLPGAGPIAAAAGTALTAEVAGDVAIGSWRARYAVYEGNGSAGTPALLAEASGAPISFPAPPAGAWSVLVEIAYPDNGEGAYFWSLTVPG